VAERQLVRLFEAGTTGNRPTADRQRSLARWAGHGRP